MPREMDEAQTAYTEKLVTPIAEKRSGGGGVCPWCSGTEWHARSYTLALRTIDPFDDDDDPLDPKGLQVRFLMCGNCGFLLQFVHDLLETHEMNEWLRLE